MKICLNCGKELPEDTIFCHYCGSSNIRAKEETITCEKCGTILPAEDDFCYACGNKINKEIGKNSKQSRKHKKNENRKNVIGIILPVILAVGLIGETVYFISRLSDIQKQLDSTKKELASTTTSLKNEQQKTNSYRIKANNYDQTLNNIKLYGSNNFFCTAGVLKNPKNARVYFYIETSKYYEIYVTYDSTVTVSFGNTSSGLVYMDVTCLDPGVHVIHATNDLNNQSFDIFIFN